MFSWSESNFLCSVVICQAICGYGAQDSLPFRPIKEGELFFVEDRDINLVELALATNIPKGCAETMVRGSEESYTLLVSLFACISTSLTVT